MEWSCIDGVEAAINRLKEKGVSIISSQDLKKASCEDKSAYGLYEYRDDKKINLAMPIWNWGTYYEKLIRSMMNNSFQTEYESSKKAFNYYWGMSAGVVDLICSNHLPESVKKLVGVLQNSICNGTYNPFQGIIKKQQGEKLESAEDVLSLQEIIDIDWLLENIEGEIPKYESLSEEGKETVNSAGAPKTDFMVRRDGESL